MTILAGVQLSTCINDGGDSMGISLRWNVDGQILAVEFTGALNEQSVLDMIEQRKSLGYLRHISPIHTILDFSKIDSFDLGIGQLNQLIGNLPQYCNSGFFVGVMNVESWCTTACRILK
jgi:hypothetical protein